MARLIDQQANYAGHFGPTFRSSAIFFKPRNIKTTISVSNYWKFKNDLDVGIVLTTRTIRGKVVSRQEVTFGDSNVINYEVNEVDTGSIELEAFSCHNLRIPYAAVMAIYETDNGISMVHSYSRNHSLIELEDDNAIVEGREGCWSLRADRDISNKAVFHNGHIALAAQEALFVVTRSDGLEKTIEFSLPAIERFETVVFHAEQIFPSLKDFLDKEDGWGTLHFESKSSFTRLLILWENFRQRDVQVTHSNFDYSTHRSNTIETSKPAFMILPKVYGEVPNAVVYPKFSAGAYTVNGSEPFSSGIKIDALDQTLSFQRVDGRLPARIVTAVSGRLKNGAAIPFECSLGVVHEKRPPKRFHWFIVSKHHPTRVHFTAYRGIYPDPQGIDLVVRLYSDTTAQIDEACVSYPTLEELPQEVKIEEIFDLSQISEFGYVSIFSDYGGLLVFSSFRKSDSLTIEHSF